MSTRTRQHPVPAWRGLSNTERLELQREVDGIQQRLVEIDWGWSWTLHIMQDGQIKAMSVSLGSVIATREKAEQLMEAAMPIIREAAERLRALCEPEQIWAAAEEGWIRAPRDGSGA